MKRLFVLALLIVMVGANALFAAVNYKELLLTPKAGVSKADDSTRAQLLKKGNWFDITQFRDQKGNLPGMVRILVVTTKGDTDCDSVTVLWLTSADITDTTAYIARDSTEFSGNTVGDRALFTANIEDSLFKYNIIAARPQCNDAAAADMNFATYLYLYNGLGELYDIIPWKAVLKIIAGGGI